MPKISIKTKGFFCLTAGLLGIVFVLIFDIIVGKPVNDISGPKSIFALVICAGLLVLGIRLSGRKNG